MTADAKKVNLEPVVSPEQQFPPLNTGKTEQQSRNYKLEICPEARILRFV
jgi:hypothetical protein